MNAVIPMPNALTSPLAGRIDKGSPQRGAKNFVIRLQGLSAT